MRPTVGKSLFEEGTELDTLIAQAERAAALLKARRDTIAVSESSTGGMLSAALLAVPGASAYFLGGAIIYTKHARLALLGIDDDAMRGMRSASEPYAALLAKTVREKHGATWGLAETGATGPAGNRYGDAAGHCCIAISGPRVHQFTLETGDTDRQANMRRFAIMALSILTDTINT